MAKISRLQLRGISHNPSDRLTEDGGCAESLNVHIEDGEIGAVNMPVMRNEDFGLGEREADIDILYIHKTQLYEHVIGYSASNLDLRYLVDGEWVKIADLPYPEKITHLGNTLIITSYKGIHYILYKDDRYIPIDLSEKGFPKLGFVNINQKSGALGGVSYDIWSFDYYTEEYTGDINGNPVRDYLVEDEEAQEALTKMWNSYRRMIDNNLERGCFSETIMLRYAFRLYDGSYLWASSPIMLGSVLPKDNNMGLPFDSMKKDNTMPVNAYSVYKSGSNVGDQDYKTIVQLSTPYKIGVNVFAHSDLSHLKDIVMSVDVFLSSPIDYMPEGYKKVKSYIQSGITDDYYNTCRRYVFDPSFSENSDKIEKAVLSASTFFLIKSYDIDKLPTETDVLTDNFLGESLFTREQLDDTKVVSHIANANSITQYNGRLIASGIDETFSRGLGVLNGQCANEVEMLTDYGMIGCSFAFAYNFPTENLIVKDHDAKSSQVSYPIPPDIGKGGMNHNDIKDMECTPYAWISHPNPNCTSVSVRVFSPEGSEVFGREIAMKPHPFLNCSYAFLGIGNRLLTETYSDESFNSIKDGEPVVSKRNTVAFSNSGNPFVFGLAGRATFSDEVMGFAVATEPMSVSQFGQYPIYFFLKDGVWTATIAADGNIGSAPVLVSRDVCSNPSTIVPTKDMVYFMSNRGLLGISGQQVVNISEHMFGDAYSVPDVALSLIENAGYSELALNEKVLGFEAFMNVGGSAIAYDYEGQRLICYNQSYEYQYAFSLKTQTWHRVQYGSIERILNTYPQCLAVIFAHKRVGSVYVTYRRIDDIGLLHDNTLSRKKIMVATRPFDLGEPDVLKTITDVRVRGNFAKGAVKFILQGSQDGTNFYTISTLRGKAWKLFRIILIADLAPTERISWIDVMSESRFTNKLR